MEDYILKIENLNVSYGDEDVVHDVSMNVEKGEIACIVGESGSGKSTLLKAIHGLGRVKVTQGCITYDCKELSKMSAKEKRLLLGTEIGVIPQNPYGSFNPVKKFKKQIKETLRSHSMEYDEGLIANELEKVGLGGQLDLLSSRPYELSGGMNQRMAIATTLLLKPKILLCDEATSALDVTTSKAIIENLNTISKENGITIIMVTHNLGVARYMAKHVGIMKSGRMIECDVTDKVFESAKEEYTRQLIKDIPVLRRS